MKTLRSGLIILVVIAFLTSAYLITNPRDPKEKNLLLDNNDPSNLQLSSLNSASNNFNNSDNNNNLTREIAKNIADQIREKNQNGLNEKNGKLAIAVPNLDTIYQETFNKYLNSDSLGLYPEIDAAKLNISLDNSQENQIKYLVNLRDINKNRFGEFDKQSNDILNDVFGKNDVSSTQQLIAIYENIVADYYQIAVPSSWVEFHKKILSHFISAKIVYGAIANFGNDPIKAYEAFQSISRIENSETEFQTLLAQGMIENNLTLENR